MRDLIRSYKNVLKRRPSVSDSDTESQPLVSSASSSASFGAFSDCIFQHDSDSTDYECKEAATRLAPVHNTPPSLPAKKSLLRRPYGYPDAIYDSPSLDIYARHEGIVDAYQYYTKSNGILTDEALIAKKVLSPFKDFNELETDTSGTQSSLITIFSIWNTIMGSSLLAMAWGLQKSGLIPGIILILFIAGICLYTTYTILQVNENHGLYRNSEVPDLCRILLGKWAETIAKVFSLIVLIGANIVYWILMSNFLYHSVHFLCGYIFHFNDTPIDNNTVICPKEMNEPELFIPKSPMHVSFDGIWNLYTTVPIFLGFLMFPLLNFRSATFFTKFNSLGTVSVVYLLLFVAVKSFSWGINIPDWTMELNIKSNFCALSGMLSLSYFIHNIIISIVKNNRHQEKNGRDLSIAYGLVTLSYLFIGVVFYICFPLAKSCIEDNLLNNFQKYDAMSIIARLLLLFQLFTVFPLMAYMLRMDIMNNINVIFKNCKFGDFSYPRVICLNIIVLTVCILFACFLPRIGTLIRYTGALSGMVYIFTLPSLLKIASLRKENALTPLKLAIHVFIITLGAVNLVSQFLINDA